MTFLNVLDSFTLKDQKSSVKFETLLTKSMVKKYPLDKHVDS